MDRPIHSRKRVRDNCFPKPYTTSELKLVLAELNYYEKNGCYSPDVTERVRKYANRIRGVFRRGIDERRAKEGKPVLTYEERKQRLQDTIWQRTIREETEG